ncbi:Putative major facilitator superfamily, MFS transporter superfamily [Septoria linicola]|uniref:Major facilitator superfamily, MFS transporter superfamily n=1 Tax=Septoria linicola TaxID=215465 RepID=A0A9Q9EIB1_9PEZI|nr:Putative major facilitator superfamily, MFS transporter superfamily [Septoria linicola]
MNTTGPKEEIESPERPLSPEPELDEDDRAAQDASLTKTKSLEQQVSLPREILVVGLIALAQFTTQVGLGQTLSILHVIGNDFGVTNPGTLAWLIAGYSLTVGTFILFTGRLGDLFGWKKMLILGYCWFGLWSMIAGLSVYSNHVLFVFARVFQGIGPAMCLPNGLALLGGLYGPGKRKNMAFAIFGACAPGGSIVGAAFASVFALAWWPWTFWSFAIALFVIAGVAAWAIPDPQSHKPGLSGHQLFSWAAVWELDLLGAFTGILALVLFNYSWNQAPLVGWGNAQCIVTLIAGVLLMPVFFWVEISIARNPLLPMEVFTASNGFVLACVALGWANFGIWIFYFWQILQELRGASPLLASAYLSPVTIFGAVAAVVTGVLMHKTRPAVIMIIALCAFMTGSILIATLPVTQIYWAQIFVTTIITPFGMDMSFPAATLVVSDSVQKSKQGVAASLVNTIVNYSISLGLGFAGTVEVHVNNGGQTMADILHGYRGAMYVAIGLSGLGILLAILFLLKSLRDERKMARRNPAPGKEGIATHSDQ